MKNRHRLVSTVPSMRRDRPRVLFVDHSARLGGAELYLLDLVHGCGADAEVVLFEEGPFGARLRDAGVPLHVLRVGAALLDVEKQAGLRSMVRALPQLFGAVRELAHLARSFDLLYANSQKAFVASALASLWTGTPLVWNLHDMLTAGHFSGLNRRLVVALSNYCATRVVVNSEATLRAYRSSGGRAPCGIVYNGIDPAPFAASGGADVAAARAELDLPADVPVVGLFGRIAHWKGQHVLLEALDHLPGVHVLYVGDALFDADLDYRAKLRAAVEARGLGPRVHFAGFRDDVPRVMKAVDVVVHASVEPEPFGRVIVEGMLAGRPVVAARAGGAQEIVRDGETGLLVSPGEPKQLAEALQHLLDHPDEARRMAGAGSRDARERFSLDAMIRRADAEIAVALRAGARRHRWG